MSSEASDQAPRARAPRPRRRVPRARHGSIGAARNLVPGRQRRVATASSASRAAGSRRPRSRSSATCRETAPSPAARSRSRERTRSRFAVAPCASSTRARISMVYQNPGSALNPSIRIGAQVAEAFTVLGASGGEARERSREALERVQIADPDSVLGRYPHQLSGGMQQRVVIAMALAKDPALLILDEPTTGLDATVEAEVLDLVARLQEELHTSVLFISHNLGVISKMCSRVGVLYAGRLVEEGPVETVLRDPRHPYTVGLLRCLPRGGAPQGPRPARHHPGVPPESRDRALGLRVRGPLRARRRALPRRGAAAPSNHRRPREPLLVPRARARPPPRGGSGHRPAGGRPRAARRSSSSTA